MLSTLYRFLTFAGAPVVNAYLRFRLSKGREDSERFAERFGHPSKARPEGPLIWCHAASVGESVSLLLLIDRIRQAHPEVSFVVTSGTVASARLMEHRLPAYAIHQYVPVDLSPGIKRFLDHWKPALALWIESELWPNMLASLKARGVPTLLLNARMSEASFKNWRRVPGFAREVLSSFALCLAQTEADLARFQALKAPNVKNAGNLKYASLPLGFDAQELAGLRGAIGDRPVWLMASTHPAEEALALHAHCLLLPQHPRLLTVIAPRHSVRGDEVAAEIASLGLTFSRRSKGEAIGPETQVYLADTMGEMGLFYALSPITVVGGSFAGTGGHNPIEPAHLGSAIVFGPSMHNFSEIEAEFISAKAAIRIDGAEAIAPAVHRLWMEDGERARLAQAARLLAGEKGIILDRIMAQLEPWLGSLVSSSVCRGVV